MPDIWTWKGAFGWVLIGATFSLGWHVVATLYRLVVKG